MTLSDTGPLVALLNTRDADHVKCKTALATISPPLLTTWPCFTEAMYLVGKAGGYPAQRALWRMRTDGKVLIHSCTDEEADRMDELMAKFRDTPMDLGDASIVAVAETLGMYRIFTIDTDFYVYRTATGRAFEVVP